MIFHLNQIPSAAKIRKELRRLDFRQERRLPLLRFPERLRLRAAVPLSAVPEVFLPALRHVSQVPHSIAPHPWGHPLVLCERHSGQAGQELNESLGRSGAPRLRSVPGPDS